MKCPKCGKNPANQDRTYGVLPCDSCQKKDEQYSSRFYSSQHPLKRYDRTQSQQDRHLKDIIQPYQGTQINPDFFKAYKDRVKDYGVRNQLEKL